MIFIERRGHAHDDNIHLRDLAIIRGGPESVLARLLNHALGNSNNIRTAAVESLHFTSVDIETGDLEMLITKQKRKRQPNVTHADDSNPRLPGLDSTLQFVGSCCGFQRHGSPLVLFAILTRMVAADFRLERNRACLPYNFPGNYSAG